MDLVCLNKLDIQVCSEERRTSRMASCKKLQGRIKQPFKSPLRASGAEISEHKDSQRDALSPAANGLPKENVREMSWSREVISKDIQEGSGSAATTPKRPLINRCVRRQERPLQKGSPRQFVSPFRSPAMDVGSPKLTLSKEEELHQLHEQESKLDEEISSLGSLGFKVEELQVHINNLHLYNEIKDTAQLVMGRLANFEGVSIKEIHEKYGATIE